MLPLNQLAFTVVFFAAAGQASAARPNLLFLLLDDQRNDSLGCAGDPILQTPEIDRLAAGGVRFAKAFVTTSICAASRATILTGLHERTHGYNFGRPPVAEDQMLASYPGRLRAAGYRSGFIGKYGIQTAGKPEPDLFDHFKKIGRSPYFKRQPDGSVRHETDLIADNAIAFLDEHPAERPFCLSLSFNAPHAEDGDKVDHYPWPPSADGLYEDATIPPPRLRDPAIYAAHPDFLKESFNRRRYFWRWDTPEKYQRNMKAYYQMISGVDAAIGRLREALQANGFADNTVIVVMADNGYYRGERGFAGKWSHYEESLRVPMVIYDPRLAEELRGRVLDTIALNLDIAPTLLDLAGIDPPASYQGVSLKPLIEGKLPAAWRTEFFAEHLCPNPNLPQWEGVRGERFVYCRYRQQTPPYEFLHDLQEDPDQLRNFANDPAYAETLEAMRQQTDRYLSEYGR